MRRKRKSEGPSVGDDPKKMQIEDKAGYAAVYAVDGGVSSIKERTIELEETHLLGRIWDIDVLDEQSVPLMRQQLGIAGKKMSAL